MKAQEAFERALRGVIEQGEFSIDVDGNCRYTHTSNDKELHCAVGHVMDAKQQRIIGSGIVGIIGAMDTLALERCPIVIDDLPNSNRSTALGSRCSEFLLDMQRAHDKAAERAHDVFDRPSGRDVHSMMDFIERMAVVALRWKLDVPIDIIDKYDAMVAETKLGRT